MAVGPNPDVGGNLFGPPICVECSSGDNGSGGPILLAPRTGPILSTGSGGTTGTTGGAGYDGSGTNPPGQPLAMCCFPKPQSCSQSCA